MKIPSMAKLSIFTILAVSLAASAALAAGEEAAPKDEKKSGTGKYYGAGVAATSAAATYATRPDRLFRNSAEAQTLSEEQLKLIKDEVQKSIDAGNNSKDLLGKRPVLVLSLSDKVPDELSLIERIRIKILGGKEIRKVDPLRDAKAEEMKHFDEQLQAFRNAGKNVGEVGITSGRKAIINAWAKRGFWLGAGSGAGLTMNDLLSLSQKLDPAEYMGREVNTSSLRKSADSDISENPNNAAAALRSAQGVQAK